MDNETSDRPQETIEEARQRYLAALHAMQAGVAVTMGIGWNSQDTTPKHLRVGVNAAMSDHGALVKLLIDRGVFTEQEYTIAIADAMERERDSYTRKVEDHYGPNGPKITLV
jgi:hypothetical protein